jgi:predicted nucleotidyltransferase
MNVTPETIIKKTQSMCTKNNAELIYLIKFGSHLYGTNINNSDEDYKGIFLPSVNSCILQKAPKSLTYSTGNERCKNTKKDIDIQLWSLQYFLELLSKGEVNALDLAYSFTHEDIVVYCRYKFKSNFFPNIRKFFNAGDCNAFVGYAIGQAKKYGIKGSRLGKIKEVLNYVEKYLANYDEFPEFGSLMKKIETKFYDSSYCFTKEKNGSLFLVLCGRMHQDTISIREFHKRLKIHYESYGERSELARQNKGLDFKALSHAMRYLYQMEELLVNNKITFPIKSANKLIEIKKGELHFNEIEAMINDKIDEIKAKLKTYNNKTKNQKFIENFILNMYKI